MHRNPDPELQSAVSEQLCKQLDDSMNQSSALFALEAWASPDSAETLAAHLKDLNLRIPIVRILIKLGPTAENAVIPYLSQ